MNKRKYRKLPVVIEAILWDRSNDALDNLSEWLGGLPYMKDGDPLLGTLEGDMKVSKGDYIIKGVKGELYPCKPDIFNATYEEVDE